MTISLILTVRNEAAALPRLLDSFAAQTHAPDEIVVVDGGSTDATLAVLRANVARLPLTIIEQPGANISQGRNTAIRAARGDIICSTDAGVRLEPSWVAELVRPLEESQPRDATDPSSLTLQAASVDVVSGFFVPDPRTVFEVALAATTLPALTDIRPSQFLPSSRSVAFRKAAWVRAQGYPEWLDYCEDLIFDLALRDAGCRFAFAPRAVAHFRPRETWRAFFKQYYCYARGDGKANLFFRRHLIRYGTYLVALPLLIALTFAAPLIALPLWGVAASAMFWTPYRRLGGLAHGLPRRKQLRAVAWVPWIRIIGDVAKMIGYPVGVVWRTQHHREAQ